MFKYVLLSETNPRVIKDTVKCTGGYSTRIACFGGYVYLYTNICNKYQTKREKIHRVRLSL